jgi:lysophospholipase L1-like esterase
MSTRTSIAHMRLNIILLSYSLFIAFFAVAGLLLAENPMWRLVIAALYTAVLILMLFKGRWRALRAFGFWFSLFLVIQTVAYDFLVPKTVALPPNTAKMLFVEGISGFSGVKRISTDSMGFRTSKTVDYKNNGTFRIFALGASTTEQALLGDYETWTSLLQESLSARDNLSVEVINTGVAGLRADQILARLISVSDFHPGMFIILTGINDWNNHIRSHFEAPPKWPRLNFVNSPLAYFLRVSWHLASSAIPQGAPMPNPLVAFTLDQESKAQKRRVIAFRPKSVQDDYQNAMKRIAGECRNRRVACLFLSQPTLYSTNMSDRQRSMLWMTPTFADYRLDPPSLEHMANLYNDWLRDFACAEGLYFFDLAARIPKSEEYMYDDVHFTERGAKAVAEALLSPIENILSGADAPVRSPGLSVFPRSDQRRHDRHRRSSSQMSDPAASGRSSTLTSCCPMPIRRAMRSWSAVRKGAMCAHFLLATATSRSHRVL